MKGRHIRVSTRVVVVVVRELFSLLTSAICVQIRGHRSDVTKIVYHMAQVFYLLLRSYHSGFCATLAMLRLRHMHKHRYTVGLRHYHHHYNYHPCTNPLYS